MLKDAFVADDFGKYLDAAWEAATVAGNLLRDNWQRPKVIAHKGAVDLVTSTDRESERRIVEVLQRHFPDHSILAEEETNLVGPNNLYRWIIDPLDGTTNFAHGYPHFGISIALQHHREIILALVYDPLTGECFRALKGHGATLNGNPIRISRVEELDQSLLATGFPYDQREKSEFYLTFLKAFMTRSQGIRCNGSAALDLCYVACARIDGFWELQLRPWDIAAGALIIEEAGGRLSDLSGNQFSIWGNETVASNGAIHDQMISLSRSLTRI